MRICGRVDWRKAGAGRYTTRSKDVVGRDVLRGRIADNLSE